MNDMNKLQKIIELQREIAEFGVLEIKVANGSVVMTAESFVKRFHNFHVVFTNLEGTLFLYIEVNGIQFGTYIHESPQKDLYKKYVFMAGEDVEGLFSKFLF